MNYLKEESKDKRLELLTGIKKETLLYWQRLLYVPLDIPSGLKGEYRPGEVIPVSFYDLIEAALTKMEDQEDKDYDDYGDGYRDLLPEETDLSFLLEEQIEKIESRGVPAKSWVSSSDLDWCGQTLVSIDHTHFEEFYVISDYLNAMTDVELRWFTRKCMDISARGMSAWESGIFYNQRAMVHYMKWGAVLESQFWRVERTINRISEHMVSLYQKGKEYEANLILTNMQLCHENREELQGKTINIDLSLPDQIIRPLSENRGFVEVFPEGTQTGSPASVNQIEMGRKVSFLQDADVPFSVRGVELAKRKEWKMLHPEIDLIQTDKKIEIPYTVCYNGDPWKALGRRRLILQEKLLHPRIERGRFKLKARSDPPFGVAVWVEGQNWCWMWHSIQIPTMAVERWVENLKKYPPMCIYFRTTNTDSVWSIVGNCQLRMKRNYVQIDSSEVKVVLKERICSCLDYLKFSKSTYDSYFCRSHGARIQIKGIDISVFCEPLEGDCVHVPKFHCYYDYNPYVLANSEEHWVTRLEGRVPYKQIANHFSPHFYSWPNVMPIGGPPLNYCIGGNVSRIIIISKKNEKVFGGIIGSGHYQQWNIPMDLICSITPIIPVEEIWGQIVFWVVTFENRMTKARIIEMQSLLPSQVSMNLEKAADMLVSPPMHSYPIRLVDHRQEPPPEGCKVFRCSLCLEIKDPCEFPRLEKIPEEKRDRKCSLCVKESIKGKGGTET